jgi:hypothetical protein
MTMQELFEKYLPTLDEMEISSTMQANGPLVSVNCGARPSGVFIAKFSTEGGGSFPVLAMNRLTAERLCHRLVDTGYGPKSRQDGASE